MRAHNVILITSETITPSIPEYFRSIDTWIEHILSLKKNPILVLGPEGDDVLRSCRHIEECDVVFDPNHQGALFSGIKAGLFATHGAAFVSTVSSPFLPPKPVWLALERMLLDFNATNGVDVIQILTQDKDAPIWPALVTAQGVKTLTKLHAQSDWDQELSFIRRLVPLQSLISSSEIAL